VRQQAASDRRGSQQDRQAGASERTDSESDRDASRSDRRAGAGERSHAELDRDTSLADRQAGASQRSRAFDDRDTARADRTAGASERSFAQEDRDISLADRGASATDREHLSFDGLTGVYQRGPGFIELEREMSRAQRMAEPLVLAFLDVDHLKDVNDSLGHAAGDRLLVAVTTALRANLRPHDLIIRYGGDEFVCAISGITQDEVATRLTLVNELLVDSHEHGSMSFGLAEHEPSDSPERLIARADAALYTGRGRRRASGS